MYNKFTQDLVDKIPELNGFDSVSCRRILTKAYVFITQSKLGISRQDVLTEELFETREILRRLADTMESISVFDSINGIEVSEDVEVACAFVAAEALSLLKSLMDLVDDSMEEDQPIDYFIESQNYIALESGLLYMIGGFDINAKSMLEPLLNISVDFSDSDNLDIKKSSKLLLYTLKNFITGDLSKVINSSFVIPDINLSDNFDNVIEIIRIHFYVQLTDSIKSYISWLVGDNQNGLIQSNLILYKIRKASSVDLNSENVAFSDIYHFSSLLLAAINKTKMRSLVNTVPIPDSSDERYKFEVINYLKDRATGSVDKLGRPFLWPSANAYVQKCLPGPDKDCVITMPTGSGKSFIAELAIVQALAKGWVLYLAPTNALVHQIRRDLKDELSEFNDIKIRSFVGGEEYTTLSEENIDFDERFIAVMTPEKCALALRLYPKQFENCSLCIFDECHLINDKNRGTNADILLTRLISLAEHIKFLLMSAMISNGEELSDWLKNVHDHGAICESINWRPTRTLRSIVALNRQDIIENFRHFRDKANALPKNRKNLHFDSSLILISGLSGPWTIDGSADYKLNHLPISFPVRVTKGHTGPNFDSWKNTISRKISERIANEGLPVINFILTSKHHAFSSAGKVETKVEGALGEIEYLPEIVKCYLTIADKELGLQTVLWDYFIQGIAIHSSSMLQVEQAASEYIFKKSYAKLMFATGTLAQGLNLPAVAVVVAGTSMGDPRETDTIYGIANDKAKSTILNAFGRAGRPGFGHQGIAILVPDNPPIIRISEERPFNVQGADIMRESDASVEVHSPIEDFIDNILSEQYHPEHASIEELTLTSLLAELESEVNIVETLGKSFGAFKKSEILTDETLAIARDRIIKVKDDFLGRPDVPNWINLATMKAGIDIFRTQAMWDAYKTRGIVSPGDASTLDMMEWLSVFFEVLTHMHPRYFSFYPAPEIRTETVLTKMRDYVSSNKLFDNEKFVPTNEWKELWQELKTIFSLYMTGKSYKEIAEGLLGIEVVNNGRSSGSNPIPSTFKLIKDVIEPIATDAGCFLALNELGVYQDGSSQLSEELQGLPIAIRNGCHSLGTLSWFRFGYRQRICAHYLNAIFPVPNRGLSDSERASWVRRTRQEFISSTYEDPLLECIRKILIQET